MIFWTGGYSNPTIAARRHCVHQVSKTGGHLSSSLGVVELTVAMHYVFNSPEGAEGFGGPGSSRGSLVGGPGSSRGTLVGGAR